MIGKLILVSILVAAVALYLRQSPTTKIPGKIVETKNGLVRGIISKSRDGRNFHQWLGIPYAKPPTGDLRFESPQPADKWEGVKDGSIYGNSCLQLKTLSFLGSPHMGDEDCLFLNINSPEVEDENLLPVMVWVHGGGFNYGSATDYRPDFFMDEDVILVSINYRLSFLGFLNTGDKNIRGNMGLKDQTLALKWVKENIQAFGGNPNQITVFGESAGSASTHYLMLSPMTKGLFQKVISQSGVATAPWASDTTATAKKYTEKFAQELNCPTENTLELTKCLKGKTAEELISASRTELDNNNIFYPHKDGHWYRPSVEAVNDKETFLAEHPLDVVKAHKFHRLPWMAGVNADEGLSSSLSFYENQEAMESFEENWTANILRAFGVPQDKPNAEEIAGKLRHLYFPTKDGPWTNEKKLGHFTKLFSDSHFFHHCSYNYWVQKPYIPVYLYYFNKRGPSLSAFMGSIMVAKNPPLKLLSVLGQLLANKVLGTPLHDYGVCHGDDLPMLFKVELPFPTVSAEEDYNFSKDMVKLWVQFATEENAMEFRGVKWSKQRHTPGRLSYLELSETPKVIQEPFESRMDILSSILKWN